MAVGLRRRCVGSSGWCRVRSSGYWSPIRPGDVEKTEIQARQSWWGARRASRPSDPGRAGPGSAGRWRAARWGAASAPAGADAGGPLWRRAGGRPGCAGGLVAQRPGPVPGCTRRGRGAGRPLPSSHRLEPGGGQIAGQVVGLGVGREGAGAHVGGPAPQPGDGVGLEGGVLPNELGLDPVVEAEHVVEHQHLAVAVPARLRCRWWAPPPTR